MTHYPMRHAALATVIVLLAACAPHPRFAAGTACETPLVTITDQFPGARRGTCTVIAVDHVQLDILPEDDPPINDSPWFAFRVEPVKPGSIRITLRYKDGHHRYIPKTSADGRSWQPVDVDTITTSRTGRKASFAVELTDLPLFVSGQELITPSVYDAWSETIAKRGVVTRSVLGSSLRSQLIHRFDTNTSSKDVLLIVGRQHPPEVSGAFGFMAFAETLFADTDLAKRFRERFRIIAVPLLNPDGVNAGNWRHNLGGVDLNRDWGPFTQPETRLIRDLLADLDADGARIRVFLDFHSTNRNVFYTQNDDFVTDPPGFMAKWLQQAGPRIENYEFENSANPVSEQANSKNYMYKRYGIPTATYEVGDETDRHATQLAAVVFAEELMNLMLDQDYRQ